MPLRAAEMMIFRRFHYRRRYTMLLAATLMIYGAAMPHDTLFRLRQSRPRFRHFAYREGAVPTRGRTTRIRMNNK